MKRLLLFLTPYRRGVALTLVLLLVQTGSELFLPTLMASIVDKGIVFGDYGHILRVGSLMLGVAMLGGAAAVGASYFAARVSAGFGRDVRQRLFSHVSRFSLHEFDEVGTATLITRTTNDVNQVQLTVYMGLRLLVMAPLMAVGGIILAVSKDARLSLILVVVVPALLAGIGLIARSSMPLFRGLQERLDRVNLIAREILTGIRVIRAFNRSSDEAERFTTANEDLTRTAIRVNQVMAAMMPLMMIILNLSTVAILWFGGIRVEQGGLQVGNLMAFIQYTLMIMFSLMMVSMLLTILPRASVSARRIADVLALEPSILDPEHPVEPEEWRGHVRFENVTFRYEGAEAPTLENITFDAKPGEMTAVVGSIGSGKSTLAKLLLRFYDVTEGRILIDGVDIRRMSQETLRRQIGYVPQTPLLFQGTVADNLRFGKEDASEQELIEAASLAQADEFIRDLEGGYGAELDQGGANLSGGQRQRLTLARALVRRPRIYVLDDTFSALDYKTDARIRQALRKATADATVILIAQRVSSILEADRIIVLDRGRIVGMGKHEELLASCPVYRELVASQLSEEASA